MKNRFDRILEQTTEPPPSLGEADNLMLEPLQELAAALARRPKTEAEVAASKDGWRRNLILWPKYRPSMRTIALSVFPSSGTLRVFVEPVLDFATADAFRAWLERWLTSPATLGALDAIAATADDGITARLTGPNGELGLVDVTAEQQMKLASVPQHTAIAMTFKLLPGEVLKPSGGVFDAAGIRLKVVKLAVVQGELNLEMVRS